MADPIYEEFFSMSLDMLCIAGTDGYFQVLNPVWERTLGYTQDELKARPFVEFVHPEDQAATLAEAGKLAEGVDTINFVNRYQAKSGEYHWMLWSARLSSDGTQLLAIARDITELKRTEFQLREATRAAQSANTAKSEFLAAMSHELRTPLNSIIGFSNVLRKNKKENLLDTQLVYLERITENGKHLLQLINDVLDVSKIEAGRLEAIIEDVDLSATVGSVLDAIEPQAGLKGLALALECPDNLATIRADRKRLEQILINLVGNALKFTHQGGVLVRVVADGVAPLRIDVVDSGIGIDQADLDRLFEAFVQADASTSREYGGTGLGLNISRALAELMGFRLRAAGEVGKGSTFSILLEARAEAPEHAVPTFTGNARRPVTPERVVPVARRRTESRPRVLIVEDEVDARMLLEKVLSEEGYAVVAADSGVEAVQMARVLRPDVITLDLMMPEVDGISVLEQLRADPETESIPVVVVSIVGTEMRSSIPSAVAVVDKPLDVDKLRQTLMEVTKAQAPKMLIVDDDEDARELMKVVAQDAGAVIREATNGAQALAILEDFRPDVILLDLMMPKMDGFSFAAALLFDRRFSGVQVVVVTGKTLSEDDRKRLAGVDVVVCKDDNLQQRLMNALQTSFKVSP